MDAVAVREFRAPPERLELPDPVPGPGELLIRMDGAGMNPFDWKIADGVLAGRRPHVFPLVLGVDGAGTVERVGADVTRFSVGDRVFGQFLHDPIGSGTYAPFATVPERNAIVPIPPGMSGTTAAALPTAGMAALDAFDVAALPTGGAVAIIGASGGIGSVLVPYAAAQGMQVIAVARAASRARLLSLGANTTIDIGERDPISAVRQIRPSGVDAIIDLASDRARFRRWLAAVGDGRTAVSTAYGADPSASAERGIRVINVDLQPRAALLERLVEAVRQGAVRVPVDHEIPLADAPARIAEGRAGRWTGKTVIRFR